MQVQRDEDEISDAVRSDDSSMADLQAILKLLPACQRCRKNKKRCDLQLPACQNCTKAEEECFFLDLITNERLPRQYVASLVDHIKALKAKRGHKSSGDDDDTVSAHLVPALSAISHHEPSPALELPVNFTNGSSVSSEMHTFLMERYFHVIHKVYPVFDWPSEFFIVTSQTYGSNRFLLLVLLSDELYRHAVAHAEDVMSQISVEALQAVLLLALRCLFDPRKGSLGQMIAFSKSLMTELASRGVLENSPLELPLRCMLSCLDNLVGSALDRPSGRPEMDMSQALDLSNQTAFLTAQYHEQWKYRNSRTTEVQDTAAFDKPVDQNWSPITQTARCETRFLVDTTTKSALELLHEYCRPNTIFTVFTAHWTYKASLWLYQEGGPQISWYPLALRTLERCSLKWPESGALMDSLARMSSARSYAGNID
ncbi:hypothetical protein AYO20_07216 [Fonsecaea nubica]|uniref:Zn(2)-C6 fungal-type domain-containing protein n=1 Tax=Fonsecaea nubica TaxID=856822 RepID=A0A178CUJ2_9EURO|nr:hypothetical protein AYO20_07216 [Fonsecaea nubica]OAL33530.1 hypothetical protein AYO20_07216 [Fonsecaea nubica]